MRHNKNVQQIGMVLLLGALVTGLFVTSAAMGENEPTPESLFAASDQCQACHNGILDNTGKDVSIGSQWRASVMAHSAKDPYWQASVAREIAEHPAARAAIEDECSTCHMPMARMMAVHSGVQGKVIANLPGSHGRIPGAMAPYAADGVSCAVCHQISPQGLGTPESFTGGFHIDVTKAANRNKEGARNVYGKFDVEPGLSRLMRSATGFTPVVGNQISDSEHCASCHTLYTHAIGKNGEDAGELPEQVPYLEWRHSRYNELQSCQSCHMQKIDTSAPVSSVLGVLRDNLRRHQFRGGNVTLLSLLIKFGNVLGSTALAAELQASRDVTKAYLSLEAAVLNIDAVHDAKTGDIRVDVDVKNMAGHKLPTAYPSRRVWIELTIFDDSGNILLTSGRLNDNGAIDGNANDADATTFEPHYTEITSTDQVQIYEAILGTPTKEVTTGLLTANQYLKDNRILPEGFDKQTAGKDIAVQGRALDDVNFSGGTDRITYRVSVPDTDATYQVHATLWYQPLSYRWAQNLADYDNQQTRQFVQMFNSLSPSETAVALETANTRLTVSRQPLVESDNRDTDAL